jgi:hypothetical protein
VSGWEVIGAMVLMAGTSTSIALWWWPGWGPAWRRRRQRVARPRARSDCLCLWPECWLAIKSRNASAVQAALSLHNPRPCSWLEGFTSADKLFVAPPVNGWVLVTGTGLPLPSEDVDACYRFVADLSRKVGLVEFFSANRVSLHHAWVRALNGRILRGYAWAGTTLWDQGAPTPEEMELALKCFGYTGALPANAFERSELMAANVQKVVLLAARWGLDPASVQQHFPRNEHGITGEAAHRY